MPSLTMKKKVKKIEKEVCSFSDHNLIMMEIWMKKSEKKPKIKKRVRDLRMIIIQTDL